MAGERRLCSVCTGNTCRSPMFAGLLRQALSRLGGRDITVESAGISAMPGEPASRLAIACMAGRGVDLADHRSRSIMEIDRAGVERFYCMTLDHALALVALGIPRQRVVVVDGQAGGIPDPCGGDRDRYEACAQALEREAERIARETAASGPGS